MLGNGRELVGMVGNVENECVLVGNGTALVEMVRNDGDSGER